MTATLTQKPVRKSQKPARSLRLTHVNGDLMLTLAVGSDVTLYWLERIPSDFGTGYRLSKFGNVGGTDDEADVYHVCVQDPQDRTCECKGFLRWGHCKHEAAVARLLELSLIS